MLLKNSFVDNSDRVASDKYNYITAYQGRDEVICVVITYFCQEKQKEDNAPIVIHNNFRDVKGGSIGFVYGNNQTKQLVRP